MLLEAGARSAIDVDGESRRRRRRRVPRRSRRARERAIAAHGSRESAIRGLAGAGESCQVLGYCLDSSSRRARSRSRRRWRRSSATKVLDRDVTALAGEASKRRAGARAVREASAASLVRRRSPWPGPLGTRLARGRALHARFAFARKPRAELRRARWQSWCCGFAEGEVRSCPRLPAAV